MKKLALLLSLLFIKSFAYEYKAVFDCSSSNAYYIKTRMMLIDKTMSSIHNKGNKATFAITIHGGCAPLASKNFEDVIDDEEVSNMREAQKTFAKLIQKKNVEAVVCEMSMAANAIDKKEILPFVKISQNSFIDTIAYQNEGYALMTFK